MLVLNLPFKALMFLTLMRPSLVLFLVLWLKLVKDFLKVRCRLALLPCLISCLIWLDLVASPTKSKIGRAVQQECRDRSRMPSSARKKKQHQNGRQPRKARSEAYYRAAAQVERADTR